MKKTLAIYLVIILLSVIPSLFVSQVTYFNDSALCQEGFGDESYLTTKKCALERIGYPTSHTINAYSFTDTSETKEGYSYYDLQTYNVLNVLVNIVFWSGLFIAIYLLASKIGKPNTTAKSKK